jgi:S-DNA-T family DNA segregation ATPase FtsK/SpoIIIE
MGTSKKKGESKGRRREILGIGLLGLGLFSLVSVASMQAGNSRLMGPGGAAAATAIYSFAGVASYLLIAASLVVAVRMCRGRRLFDGVLEPLGFLSLLASTSVLCHLPFSDEKVTLNGPGGLIGQYIGQIVASFVGGVGAALAATTLLATAVLLLTDIRVSEVLDSLEWAWDHVVRAVRWSLGVIGRAAVATGRAAGRIVVAMFPEKPATEESEADTSATADADGEIDDEVVDRADRMTDDVGDDTALPTLARIQRGAAPDDQDELDTQDLVAARQLEEQPSSEEVLSMAAGHPAITLGETLSEPVSQPQESAGSVEVPRETEERRAVAAVVAEVAAVECAALAEAEAEATKAKEPTPTPQQPAIAIIAPVTSTLDDGPTEACNTVPDMMMAELGPTIVPPVVRPVEKSADKAAEVDGPGFIRLSDGAFQLPSSELLEYIPPKGTETDENTLRSMAERLEQALGNYGVRGKVTAIQMGPVIVTFEFAPAPGTRTGKIVQLENDLAMALEAQSVRIVAPIPGKAVVGIEIPNKKRETVYLKEILEDESFRKSDAKLQICLGKDTKGAPVSVNLAKMPHLLVAGTTGSGKSVAVNGMITSILYSATPEEVRFIMVDPKMLELSIYEGIPHLLLPVVTDPKKASLALRWAVDEMERRYELLAKTGVRDIASYNAKVEIDQNRVRVEDEPAQSVVKHDKRLKVVMADADGNEQEVEVEAESGPQPAADGTISQEMLDEISDKAAAAQFAKEHAEPPMRKLPYIVIVIDEFADLMMVASKEVDTAVARLAQKARAAGLHLILATQRPSVDVITGVIKANFPSRIALQVASQIDSRTIMGQPGAETLLGNGDMLFSDRGTKLKRIQGAFLSDDEVHRVVDFLKKQAKPVYDMNILVARDEEDGEGAAPADDFHDELYDQAVAIVCDTRQASVSFIQRRLQIGYNRAARMVEQMEREGLVGPSNGIKPREVLAPRGDYLSQPGA